VILCVPVRTAITLHRAWPEVLVVLFRSRYTADTVVVDFDTVRCSDYCRVLFIYYGASDFAWTFLMDRCDSEMQRHFIG